jgi:predicted small lipoprotein YifL
MTMKKMLCLMLALAMCLSLAACGKSGGETAAPGKNEPVEENPEFVYTAKYKTLVKDTKNYLQFRGYTDEGFYVSSMEKTGENIPAGMMPRYEGEYDVYGTFLYFVDFAGNMKKTENTVGIHWYDATWLSASDRKIHSVELQIGQKYPPKVAKMLCKIYRNGYRFCEYLKNGVLIEKIIRKIKRED